MPRKPLIPVDLASRPFDIEEARRHGLSKYHLDGPTWTNLGGGVFVLSAISDKPMIKLAAAMKRLPFGAVFSGKTAGWLHGLDLAACSPIEVTVPISSKVSRRAGIAIHRCDVFETALAKGLPVTSRVRTVVDLARRNRLSEAVQILDMALHSRKVTKGELRQWVLSHPRCRGITTLRRAIELAEPATESPMETTLRMVLVLAGLPRPGVQVSLCADDGSFLGRPDLYYPAWRLAIEYDGAMHRDSLESDNRRQNRLVYAGIRLLRFTAADVLRNPETVVSLVRRSVRSGL